MDVIDLHDLKADCLMISTPSGITTFPYVFLSHSVTTRISEVYVTPSTSLKKIFSSIFYINTSPSFKSCMVNGTVSTILARPDLKRFLTLTFRLVGVLPFW